MKQNVVIFMEWVQVVGMVISNNEQYTNARDIAVVADPAEPMQSKCSWFQLTNTRLKA